MKSRSFAVFITISALVVLTIPASTAQDGSIQAKGTTTTTPANPVPLINQPLVPDAINPGGTGFTLTLNGSGFVSGSVVKWNGSVRTTTFVSKSQLTATILPTDIAKAGTVSVTVADPSLGGGTSNVVFFQVTPATSSVELSAQSVLLSLADPPSITVGDFNGDGKLDIAAAEDASVNGVWVLLGNGDGTFQSPVEYSAGSGPESVAAGDFNADGKLDLVAVNIGSDNVSVLLGNGDGTFQAPVNYGTGSAPNWVAVGDFNGDGKLDLAVTNYNGSNVSVLLGNGDGTFQPAVNYGTGSYPNSVAVGDFNRDGNLDLVVANHDDLSVLLGNGNGTFQPAVNYGTGAVYKSVAVGDFNGDGKLDLVTVNDSATVLLGNGDGTFQAAVSYATGSIPTSVAVGDFNGDGKLDVVTANNPDDTVSVLLGNGDGTFQAHQDFGPLNQPLSVAVGDFNSDGRLDIAAAAAGVAIQLQVPTVSLSKPSLIFANQLVGSSSASQTVTLTNTSVLALKITNIAVAGTNASDFRQTNTCGSGLPPAGTCTITVTFTPAAIGPKTASVTITDNAVDSPQNVALSGIGVVSGSNATLSTTSLTFAMQLVGIPSPAQTFMLINFGTATLTINGVNLTGADPSDFAQTNTCGGSVGPGGHCTISVTFTPEQRRSRTATLAVTDNAPGSPQTVSLQGTGTVVELNPTSLSFGNQSIGTTTTQSTTLTNVGTTALIIAGIAIAGTDTDEFRQTNTCGTSVGARKSCTIAVTFTPREKGGDGAEVSISDNGGDSPQQVSLSGSGCVWEVIGTRRICVP